MKLTAAMAVDFVGCYAIEHVCKALFADLEPKEMITRGRERREARRKVEEEKEALEVARKAREEVNGKVE